MGRAASRSPRAATADGGPGMSMTRSTRVLTVLCPLIVGLALVHPSAASAASLRLRVWDFNACDQFGRGNLDCEVTPSQRATAISQSITSFAPDVVTFQEMCRSTFDM